MIILAIIPVLAGLYVLLAVRLPWAALITAPVASGAFGALAARYGSLAGMMAAPLIFALTMVAIILSRRDPDRNTPPQAAAKCTLVVAGIVLALLIGVALGPGSFLLFFYLLFAAGLLALLLHYLVVSRAAVAEHVIAAIGASMRQNLPLAAALDSAAAGQNDQRAKVLRRIAMYLARGVPLSQALCEGYRACPGQALAAVVAAERIGQLPRAMELLERDLAGQNRRRERSKLIYPALVLLVALLVVTAVGVFILPKYQAIFRSFEQELPASTRWLMGNVLPAAPLAQVAWLLAAAVGVPAGIYACFRPRRPHQPRLLSRIGDFLKWHTPFLRWFERNHAMRQTVEMLRLALAAGATVDEAIGSTLGLDVNGRFRRRLRRWHERVVAGEDVSAAARASGLGRGLAWAFDNQTNPGNAPEVLETLEGFHRANYSYVAGLAEAAFWPAAMIALAGFVGFVAYAMIAPLASLYAASMVGWVP